MDVPKQDGATPSHPAELMLIHHFYRQEESEFQIWQAPRKALAQSLLTILKTSDIRVSSVDVALHGCFHPSGSLYTHSYTGRSNATIRHSTCDDQCLIILQEFLDRDPYIKTVEIEWDFDCTAIVLITD